MFKIQPANLLHQLTAIKVQESFSFRTVLFSLNNYINVTAQTDHLFKQKPLRD